MPEDETKHKTKHSSTSAIFAGSTKKAYNPQEKYCITSAIVQLIIYALRFIAWQKEQKIYEIQISKRMRHIFWSTFGNCIFQWRMMAINSVLCRPNHKRRRRRQRFKYNFLVLLLKCFDSLINLLTAVLLRDAWAWKTVTHSLLIVSDFYFVLIDLPMDSLITRLSHNRGISKIHLPTALLGHTK